MSIAVTALHITPVKGTRVRSVERVELESSGAAGDRVFFVIDGRDRMRNGKQLGSLQAVVATLQDECLRLELPDGSVAEGPVELGDELTATFYSRPVTVRAVLGPWSQALSEQCGQPLRLVHCPGAVDRGPAGAVSLISRGSLRRLGEEADAADTADAAGAADAADGEIDPRRFRMLIEVDGAAPHAEDDWVGHRFRLGTAEVSFTGHVGRCLVTSRDPVTGTVTLPTLDLLRGYRSRLPTSEPLPFGVHGAVLRPGTVRVGDLLEPVEDAEAAG